MRKIYLLFASSVVLLSTINYSFSMMGDNDDFPNLKTALKRSLQGGDDPSGEKQYQLGMIYLKDPIDYDKYLYSKAIYWLEESAKKNNHRAQNVLSKHYLSKYQNEDPHRDDLTNAVKWARKAASEANIPEAQNRLGWLYQHGIGVAQDPIQMAHWWRLAAESDNVEAQYRIGWAYECGSGVNQNHSEARRWYGEAAKNGHKEAKEHLSKLGIQQ